MTVWVLTKEYNEYDQYGEYFVHAWDHAPTANELFAVGVPASAPYRNDLPAWITDTGGGRFQRSLYHDEQWYFLKELK
jgi:hypothetical protein